MTQAAQFWDGIAERYAATPVKDEDSYRRKLAETRAHFTPETEILELGCGTGTTAIHHAPHVKHILATDVSPEMLKIARGKAEEAGITNVTWREVGYDAVNPVPESLDMVMAHSLLHLVPDADELVATAFRALRPGGLFVSSTVCIGHRYLVRLALPLARALGKAPAVTAFRPPELLDRIRGGGFEIVDDWIAGSETALFVIARKPGTGAHVAA